APSAVWSALTRSLILDTYCVIVLWAITYLFFEPSLRELRIAYENDTRVFYYPIFVKLGEAWRSGHLQLWSTDILTGYPVFADGEAGVLYPFHLLALMFLSVDDAFVWLRPIRFFQGALFMFGFLRATEWPSDRSGRARWWNHFSQPDCVWARSGGVLSANLHPRLRALEWS
ncbi:MAG: hypothetical protein EB145_08135, partial [Proteobacteria bacterium]|nr:hypothetical protein [Pseudomonadota bacterium]